MRSYAEQLQPPCSDAELHALRHRARLELGHDAPDEYVRFLKRANGIDWNGLVIYASERAPIVGHADRSIDGFVDANLDFRDHSAFADYLVFADDGVALFVYHVTRSVYQAITRVGLVDLESFRSFDDLIANALSGHI